MENEDLNKYLALSDRINRLEKEKVFLNKRTLDFLDEIKKERDELFIKLTNSGIL